MTVCCAAVLAFGLAACGSSSDDDRAMMPTEPTEPTMPVEPVDPGPTPAEVTKAAGTKAKAIGKVTPDNAELDAVDVTVTAKRTGPEIKVEGDDDFTHVMGPMYRLEHAADDDGNVVEEIVLVDHTITSPKGMGFAKVYTLDVSTDETNDVVDEDPTNEAFDLGIALVSTAPADARVLARVMSAAFAFPSDEGSQIDLEFEADTTANNEDEAEEVAGTYDGAPGTYRCNSTTDDCMVQLMRGAMGKVSISMMSDGWIFTPDAGARVYVVDKEYASFGIWLKRTTDADGVLTYNMVDTFLATGTPVSNSVGSVQGTATYAGSALGVYVHNVLDPAGEVASATGGMFTADAELMATFLQIGVDLPKTGTIAPAHFNTITGTIDNFELAGGEAQSWSVELMRSGTYDEMDDDVAFAGKTKGGGAEGDYSGRFYGDTGTDNDVAPSTVAGEFTANFLNGNVAGGFGATKQKD